MFYLLLTYTQNACSSKPLLSKTEINLIMTSYRNILKWFRLAMWSTGNKFNCIIMLILERFSISNTSIVSFLDRFLNHFCRHQTNTLSLKWITFNFLLKAFLFYFSKIQFLPHLAFVIVDSKKNLDYLKGNSRILLKRK